MPDAHDAIQEGLGVAFSTLKDLFFESGTEVLLLKPTNDAEREFEVVWQVTDKWFFEYSAYRQNFLLEIAEDSTDLDDNIPQATHIQIDSDVYEISQSDTLPPKGTDVTWKVFCTRYARRANYAAL